MSILAQNRLKLKVLDVSVSVKCRVVPNYRVYKPTAYKTGPLQFITNKYLHLSGEFSPRQAK